MKSIRYVIETQTVITVHPRFREFRSSVPFVEVNRGSGGLHLYSVAELAAGQIGYAVGPDGSSLCTGEDGAWLPGWLVIGFDTRSGDPILMDMSAPELPVLRDFNGQGKWEPVKIAISLEAFLAGLRGFACLAKGRSTPVELEANPLPQSERADFLARISDLNNGQVRLDFWEALVDG